MRWFSRKKDLVQELTKETKEAESGIWNTVLRLDLPREQIQRPEITYLALALMTYSLFRWGRAENVSAIADKVTLNILTERLRSDKSALPQVLGAYRVRHKEYAHLLPKLFDQKVTENERFFLGIEIARHITGQDRGVSALLGTFLTGLSVAIVAGIRDVLQAA